METEAQVDERMRRDNLSQCEKGLHNWQHFYDFARCSICGETMDIPTASDYRYDN